MNQIQTQDPAGTGAGTVSAGVATNPNTDTDSTRAGAGENSGGMAEDGNQDVEAFGQHPQGDAAINGEQPPAEIDGVEVDQQTPKKKPRKERTAKQQANITLAAIDRATEDDSADLMLRRAESWLGWAFQVFINFCILYGASAIVKDLISYLRAW